MPPAPTLRLGTLNLASGRSSGGAPLAAYELARAVADLDVDVLALQEVDAGQPRSHGVHQAAEVARALGADWRMCPTVAGTPDPFRSWQPAAPSLRGVGDSLDGPAYGIALLSRRPVRRWHVLGLGSGRARLPVRAPDPRTGRPRTWWFPDEPRAAVAAEVDGATVVSTHLSFAPHTSVRQLLRLRRWVAGLPGPVVVAGDLNLPGSLPARLLRGRDLVRTATFPAAEPRVQLDHLVLLGDAAADDGTAVRLPAGRPPRPPRDPPDVDPRASAESPSGGGQEGAQAGEGAGEARVQRDVVERGERDPRGAGALAVQPQVGGLDRPRRPGQHRRVAPAAVVVDRVRAEDDVVRHEAQLLADLAQRAGRGVLVDVQRAARRPPGAAVVRPVGAVLEQHLRADRAVAVQQQAGGAGAAPVAVAEGARRPAVGRGQHAASLDSGPCASPSSPGPRAGPPSHRSAAAAFAADLARAGVGVVYGGGHVGLMGVVADAALEAGGEVVGVIPQHLVDDELAHPGLPRLEVVDSMHERKARMAELSDVFVALPGAAGTLEELFEAWTWGMLGLHAKPTALFDVDGFWQPLLAQLRRMVDDGYLDAAPPRRPRRGHVAEGAAGLRRGLRAPAPASGRPRARDFGTESP